MTWTSQYKDTDDVVLPPSSQSPQEWMQYLTDQDANANGDEKSDQAMQQRSNDHSNNNSNNNNRSCDNKSVQTCLCDQLRQLHQWWLYQRPNLVDSLHRTQRIYYHRREQLTTVQQRFHIFQESRKRNEMNRTTTTTSDDLKKTTTPTKDSNNHNNNDKNQSLLQHMLLTQISEMLEYYQSQTRLSTSSSLSFVNHQQDMETLSSFFPILSHFAMNHNKDQQVFIHDDDHHHDDNEKKEINQKAMVLEVMLIRTFLIEKHEQITRNVNDKTTTSNMNNEISTTTNTTMVDPLALSFSTVTLEDISRWLETIHSFLFLSTPKDSLGNTSGDMSGDMSNGISQSSYDDNDNNNDDTNNKYNINKYNNKSVLWRIPTLSSWNDFQRHDDSSCSLELSLDMFQKELEQLVHDLQQHCLQKQNKLRQLDHEMALCKVHLERDITKYIQKKRQLYTNSRTATTVHNKPSTTTQDKDKTEIVENEIENDVDDDDFRIEIRPMGPLLLEQGPPIT